MVVEQQNTQNQILILVIIFWGECALKDPVISIYEM